MQQVTVAQVPTYATTEAASADPDFLVQGEYVGNARAMQVVALGDGEFEVSFFNGGLPGAGWDRSPPQKFDADAEQVAELVESNQFARVERSSPTLGQKPPSGAIVLFDGSPTSLVDHWQPGAQLSDDGLLMQGATSLDAFDNYSLHLEFRTPFMPTARGQARGNSGLYHQGRYETQILDSFGLEGKMNETGGLYSIKDPDLNMCLPPLVWQTYDVDFTAAQFDDDGKQLSQPRITVRVNGVTVQQDVLLPHATTAAPQRIGPTPGPIFLQDHGNPVRFRNIWVVPRDLVQEAKRPRLAGFERFYARGQTSALGGRLLIHELGCAACHATGESPVKQAPVLDRVGSRIRPDHLLAFIADPHAAKPGTTMPDVLADRSPAQRQQAARALASFLLTTGVSVDRFGDPRAVTRGDELFHSIGCTACHAPQTEGTIVAQATSHPLAHLGDKYTLDSLSDFLRAPHKVRPSGRMPSMGLNEQQASDIATYLLRSVIIGQGALNTHAAFYEGSWNSLPDLDELKPILQLQTYGLDILASKRSENFAARFDTFIVLPKDADYTFQLTSDDGSRLFVDGQEIIDHDGVHPANSKSARVRLTGGSHALRVEYFEAGGEEALQLDVRGGGLPLTSIESLATLDPSAQQVAPLIESQFSGVSELVDQGRQLFLSSGCANCHALTLDQQRLNTTLHAKAFSEINVDGGCLAARPPANVPQYDLSDSQRAAIRLAAEEMKRGVALDDEAHVQLSMASMNCYACHSRDGMGGPEISRNPLFKTSMKEMGDEGRLPPPLDGAGDKLQRSYLESILDQGADERPYMFANMPGFGADNVGGLVERLLRLDEQSSLAESDKSLSDEPFERLKSNGRLLVGDKGLSCVKCHVFGGKGAPGIGAIDLQRMTTRLREDWFHRYLMSPTTYRPGTRMPASFPQGQSVLPDLYHGQPSAQIAAMWSYLADGKQAREPIGVQQQLIELVPSSRPTIYRNFIEGLTPRGIAVGYPQGGNLAWDADRLSLSLLWKGAFIDASKHWVGRGPGNQGPLGDEPVSFEGESPLAVLDQPNELWPTDASQEPGTKFLGYRLDAQGQPTFRYRIAGVTVEDTPRPVVEQGRFVGFDRTLKLNGTATGQLYFRGASAQQIAFAADGWYRLDDRLSVRLNAPAVLVEVGGHSELRWRLPPVSPSANAPAGDSLITQQIRW